MKLAKHSGVFICMVTALEFTTEGDSIKCLHTIQVSGLPGGDVHALHRQILETSFLNSTESLFFVKLIAARKYFTAEDWVRLLQTDVGTIKGVHSMLCTTAVDGGVTRFRRQLFVDFLHGPGDAASNQPKSGCPKCFRIDVSEAHHTH